MRAQAPGFSTRGFLLSKGTRWCLALSLPSLGRFLPELPNAARAPSCIPNASLRGRRLFLNITILNQDESRFCVHRDMAELDDPQHEKACQLRASGMTQSAAYAQAFGQAEDSGANNSSRFFRQAHVKDRVSEIKRWRSAMANLDEAWVLVQLKAVAKNAKAIGDANLDDFFARNADGRRLGIDLADVSRAKMAVLEEVTVEEYFDGRGDDAERIKRTKIKLRNAQSSGSLAALELLGKHLGMWPSKTAISDPDGKPLGSGAVAALVPVINLLGKPEGM